MEKYRNPFCFFKKLYILDTNNCADEEAVKILRSIETVGHCLVNIILQK